MLLGQFGKIQISELSARPRGQRSRRKIVRNKPAAISADKFGQSRSAGSGFGSKWKRVAAANSQEPEFTDRASGRLLAPQPCLNRGLVFVVLPDCGNQHVDIEQVSHGGNCSSAFKTSSREIFRRMESSECLPLRRIIRTLFLGFGFGRSIRTSTRRPSPSGNTLTTSPLSIPASFRAWAGITICPRP